MDKKKILIAGGSGFIGTALKAYLEAENYIVNILTRSPRNQGDYFWDTEKMTIDPAALTNVHCLINLSGDSIGKPWTKKHKENIVQSRVQSLKTLEKNIPQDTKLPLFISASAVGIYGNRGEELVNEYSVLGDSFLAKTSIIWEKAFNDISLIHTRKVNLRISNVMDKKAGMLGTLMKLSKLGILSPQGSGKQWVSWIDLHDLCRVIEFIISNENIVGVVNGCNNEPIRNSELCRALNKYNGFPNWLPNVPAFMLAIILGPRKSLVLDGQKVSPKVLTKQGFSFLINDIQKTLKK